MQQVPEKEAAQGLSSLPQWVCGHNFLSHSRLILSHSPGKENQILPVLPLQKLPLAGRTY